MVTGLWSPSIFFNIALALHSVPYTNILYASSGTKSVPQTLKGEPLNA